ncbi:MAG: ABC transporter permease, partial [Bacteroidota bacterium]
MLALKLAYKNLMGAGLRTWLNAIVLSFSFVLIIGFKAMLDGWDREAKLDSIKWEIGGGQYWHENYDPTDPFTLTDSHSSLSSEQEQLVDRGSLVPVLITRGTIYPEGRMQNILIKGIDENQKVLAIPTKELDTIVSGVPAIIGAGMAESNKLVPGDRMT